MAFERESFQVKCIFFVSQPRRGSHVSDIRLISRDLPVLGGECPNASAIYTPALKLSNSPAATDCDATARNRARRSSHAHGGTSMTGMCVGTMLVCASQACGVMRWSTGVFCARRCAVGYMGRASVPVLSSGHITQATPDLFSTLTLSWVEPS